MQNLLSTITNVVGANAMGDMHVNYLAIVVAAIANMVVGALWYGPMLFAKQWMAWNNMSAEEIKKINPGPLYAQSLVATLLTYFVLASC